jgi:hypothetical protein
VRSAASCWAIGRNSLDAMNARRSRAVRAARAARLARGRRRRRLRVVLRLRLLVFVALLDFELAFFEEDAVLAGALNGRASAATPVPSSINTKARPHATRRQGNTGESCNCIPPLYPFFLLTAVVRRIPHALLNDAARPVSVRAYDSAMGKVVWQHQLEGAPVGIPSIYEVNGREHVVFCVRGALASDNLPPSPKTVAQAVPNRDAQGFYVFALPRK